jgi:3-oxoacyl-[acyl-carrier protein] reductase
MPAALVTGAAKGIGKAIATALAKDGYDLAIHYYSSRSEARALAKDMTALGRKAVSLQADVRQAEAATKLVEQAHTALGRLDVLVNNVGSYHNGPLDELSIETWHEMFDSNLHATFYTCRAAVKLMRAEGGRIINLGYAGAEQLVARPRSVAYGIAKTGVILYSKALAVSEAKYNITVNVVSPGVMENSLSKPVSEIPIGRTGTLDELSAAIRYLISAEARYVTGITLEVAGGWHL